MGVSLLFSRIRRVMAQKRRDRRNYQALAHLDVHLLKDIGLYREQGIVRPLYPENIAFVEAMPVVASETARTEAEPIRYCPRCGLSLA